MWRYAATLTAQALAEPAERSAALERWAVHRQQVTSADVAVQPLPCQVAGPAEPPVKTPTHSMTALPTQKEAGCMTCDRAPRHCSLPSGSHACAPQASDCCIELPLSVSWG